MTMARMLSATTINTVGNLMWSVLAGTRHVCAVSHRSVGFAQSSVQNSTDGLAGDASPWGHDHYLPVVSHPGTDHHRSRTEGRRGVAVHAMWPQVGRRPAGDGCGIRRLRGKPRMTPPAVQKLIPGAYERSTLTYRQSGSMGGPAFGSADLSIGPSSMDAATIAERKKEGGGALSQRRPVRP